MGENDKNADFEMVEFPRPEAAQIVDLESLFPRMNDSLVGMADKHWQLMQRTFDYRSQRIEPQE